MKILQSSLFRAIAAIAIGVLLVKYPDNTVEGIVIAIGILFLLSGLISVLTYIQARRHASEYKIYDAEGRLLSGGQPTFPIVAIGSMILGAILALAPTTFISALTYVIGAVLVLGAINQLLNLIDIRRYASISFWFWLCPVITLLIGCYIIIKPMAPATLAMTVLGWLSLFYGVTEAVNSLKIHLLRKQISRRNASSEVLQLEETEDLSGDNTDTNEEENQQ